ncbi:MAG: hypothetical protein Q9227_000077 [Pyrenula ochraceoflavens]
MTGILPGDGNGTPLTNPNRGQDASRDAEKISQIHTSKSESSAARHDYEQGTTLQQQHGGLRYGVEEQHENFQGDGGSEWCGSGGLEEKPGSSSHQSWQGKRLPSASHQSVPHLSAWTTSAISESEAPITSSDPEKQQQSTSASSTASTHEYDGADLPPASRISTDAQGNTYPEGGKHAWLCVLGSFCALLAVLGETNTFAVYQNYFISHQLAGTSVGKVGWIFGVYAFLAFFGGIQFGPIFDAIGPRVLVFAGSVITVASTLILAQCQTYWQFMLVFGLLAGLGMSLVFTPAIASIGHYFLLKRGQATGIAATGGAFGGIIFTLMLQALFPKVGYAWAIRVQALVQFVLLVVGNLLIRSRLPPKPLSKENVLPDFRIFRDPIFALTTAGTYFMEWGLFIPVAYISSYAIHNGIPEAFAYQLLAILNAGSIFGRWLPGYLADRFGRFNSMIFFLFLCLVSSLAIWLPAHGSKALLIIFSVMFGFGSGSNISLTPVCVGQLCRTENYGRYYATAYSVVSLGTLTGIPIAGEIVGACKGEYWGLIAFTVVSYAVSIACYVMARGLGGGWGFRTRF